MLPDGGRSLEGLARHLGGLRPRRGHPLGSSRRNVAAAKIHFVKDTSREMEEQMSPTRIMLSNVCSIEYQPSDHSMARPMVMPSTYHPTARLSGVLDSHAVNRSNASFTDDEGGVPALNVR